MVSEALAETNRQGRKHQSAPTVNYFLEGAFCFAPSLNILGGRRLVDSRLTCRAQAAGGFVICCPKVRWLGEFGCKGDP